MKEDLAVVIKNRQRSSARCSIAEEFIRLMISIVKADHRIDHPHRLRVILGLMVYLIDWVVVVLLLPSIINDKHSRSSSVEVGIVLAEPHKSCVFTFCTWCVVCSCLLCCLLGVLTCFC